MRHLVIKNSLADMAINEFLDEKGKWKCIKCAACCKLVKDQLPDFAKEDGSCKYLVDNQCSIYDSRPDICRVDLNRFDMSDVVLATFCDMTRNTVERNKNHAV